MYKRLFFGFDVLTLPEEALPQGRRLPEASLHLTLAFLGNVDYAKDASRLAAIPKPPFTIGFTGMLTDFMALPQEKPTVIAQYAQIPEALIEYQKTLAEYLFSQPPERDYLPHVTIARSPFDLEAWRSTTRPRPFYSSALHLYESSPGLSYTPIQTHTLLPPFETIDHTADIAYLIRGRNLEQLLHNAFTALAFEDRNFVFYTKRFPTPQSIEDIVDLLNDALTYVDTHFGSSIKAVSYHGMLKNTTILSWEMIIDV